MATISTCYQHEIILTPAWISMINPNMDKYNIVRDEITNPFPNGIRKIKPPDRDHHGAYKDKTRGL